MLAKMDLASVAPRLGPCLPGALLRQFALFDIRLDGIACRRASWRAGLLDAAHIPALSLTIPGPGGPSVPRHQGSTKCFCNNDAEQHHYTGAQQDQQRETVLKPPRCALYCGGTLIASRKVLDSQRDRRNFSRRLMQQGTGNCVLLGFRDKLATPGRQPLGGGEGDLLVVICS